MALIIGTISHGTHRSQDLLQAFSNAYKQYMDDEKDYNPFLFMAANLLADILNDLDGDHVSDSIYEDADYTLERLIAILEDFASKHDCYFGTTEGDGSDFGFWPNDGGEEIELDGMGNPIDGGPMPE